eukprot:COSAG04_NODE_12695_length_639_cov_0.900000_2_plen_139_part_00
MLWHETVMGVGVCGGPMTASGVAGRVSPRGGGRIGGRGSVLGALFTPRVALAQASYHQPRPPGWGFGEASGRGDFLTMRRRRSDQSSQCDKDTVDFLPCRPHHRPLADVAHKLIFRGNPFREPREVPLAVRAAHKKNF